MSRRWYRRILSLCPLVVALLWVGGFAGFRGYPLGVQDYLLLAAAGSALHILMQLLRPPRPMPPLPEGVSPPRIALLGAMLLAALAAVVGGTFEWLVEGYQPTTTPWPLRTLWHVACVFAGSYCVVLHRLSLPPARRPPPAA